jgi:hypothetical protein
MRLFGPPALLPESDEQPDMPQTIASARVHNRKARTLIIAVSSKVKTLEKGYRNLAYPALSTRARVAEAPMRMLTEP